MADAGDLFSVWVLDVVQRFSYGDVPFQWKGRRFHLLPKSGVAWKLPNHRDVGISDGAGKGVKNLFKRKCVCIPGW